MNQCKILPFCTKKRSSQKASFVGLTSKEVLCYLSWPEYEPAASCSDKVRADHPCGVFFVKQTPVFIISCTSTWKKSEHEVYIN